MHIFRAGGAGDGGGWDALAPEENPVIDPRGGWDEHVFALQESGTTGGSSKGPRGRRWLWRMLLVALFLGGGLLWLNGPGVRWLGPMLAGHFLAKAGVQGGFVLDGSFTGGLELREVDLRSAGTLARLRVEHVRPHYRVRELLGGRLRGITVRGVRAELRMDAEKPEPPDKRDAPSLDEMLEGAMRLRAAVVPMEIDIRDVAWVLRRGGEKVVAVDSGALSHQPGSGKFQIELVGITDRSGKRWADQQPVVEWADDSLAISRIEPLPGWSLRGMQVAVAAGGGLAAEAELHAKDAVFMLSAAPGMTAVMLDLREGRFDSRWIEQDFGIKLPGTAELSSLAVSLDNPLPDLRSASGSVRMLLENVAWENWQAPELGLDVMLEEGRALLAIGGRAMETPFSLRAETAAALPGQPFPNEAITGTFIIEDVAALAAALDDRFDAWSLRGPLPPSMADGSFKLEMLGTSLTDATVDLALKPADADQVPALFLKSRWQAGKGIQAELMTEGVAVKANHPSGPGTYQAEAAFDGFRSERMEPWLEPFGIDPGGRHVLTGKIRASGQLAGTSHEGNLEVTDYQLERDGMPALKAAGSLQYDWPSGFSLKLPRVECAGQTISADVAMADGWLQVHGLKWSDGERELLGGTGKLPVPADLTHWREAIAKDRRPLDLKIESATLPLAVLADWLPAAARIDASSTGKLAIEVSGTFAEPAIDAAVQVRDFRLTDQPDLLPADIDLRLRGGDAVLVLEGSLAVPGHPAAQLMGRMPFRPAVWAEKPGILADEAFTARADLPRLELAKFVKMLPGLKNLGGRASGSIDAAGTIAKPAFKGRLDLTNVALEFENRRIPPVTGGTVAVDLTPEMITLADLRANCAAGTLRGTGNLTLVDAKPAALDFRVIGNRLPVVRNESMIVRADADLRLAGEFSRPALTGSITVVDSLFYRDIELLPIGVPFTTPSAAALPGIDAPLNPAAGVPEAIRDWPLDVRVRTGNPFLIRGNFADGKVVADLRVGGSLGAPAPDGEVRLNDIKAALPFSTLEVRKGTLRFTPETGFDPLLEIRATSNPRPYRVNGYLYGRASDPQLVLTSSPPLPENEIMTLLATGTTTRGLENPQMASARAMQLLAEEIRRGRFGVGRQLRPLLGLLDRVDFTLAEGDLYSGDIFSTATLELTDRWYLSAGLSDEGDTRVLAIWRLVFH